MITIPQEGLLTPLQGLLTPLHHIKVSVSKNLRFFDFEFLNF